MTNHKHALAGLTLVLLCACAYAAPTTPMRAVEDATEANARTVSMPRSDTGDLFFHHCDSCNAQPFHLSKETKYYLGSAQVSFDVFKRTIEQSKTSTFTIFYAPGGRDVTRIVGEAQPVS